MHYAPSAVTNPTNQTLATGLIIGQRVPPHVFIRAADARPFELQDLLPSDTRFKVLVFAGDTVDAAQLARVRALAAEMGRPEGFLERFGSGEPGKVFDILSISSAKKTEANYNGALF